jgi:hypothetical protein
MIFCIEAGTDYLLVLVMIYDSSSTFVDKHLPPV